MLRRTQSIASIIEREKQDAPRPEAEQPDAQGIERRRHPRVTLDTPDPEAGQPDAQGVERRRHPRVTLDTPGPEAGRTVFPNTDRRKGDRRKGDRQSMEALRAEVQKILVPESAKNNRGPARFGGPWSWVIKPSRVILLLVALLSGGLAASLATQRDQPGAGPAIQTITEVVQVAKMQVLVAKEPIGVGQRLSPESVAWADWPEDSVRSEYVTFTEEPEAIANMTGSVARFEFFPGEPIRTQKLAQTDQGYLSAILGSGMRGVSVSVTAESASGGFIVPNDHVDVVLTRLSDMISDSQTILHNVRVLAINTRLGETGKTGAPEDLDDPRAQMFEKQAIATLELNPAQAEVVISAGAGGSLSLVLLSITDFAKTAKTGQSPANAAIRVSSPFWTK